MKRETKAGHTPGPWKYEVEQKGISWIVGPEVVEKRIAVGGGDLKGIRVCAIAKDTESNARLIAAAPELLEIIKLLIHPKGTTFMEATERAKQIIAKAEGRQ